MGCARGLPDLIRLRCLRLLPAASQSSFPAPVTTCSCYCLRLLLPAHITACACYCQCLLVPAPATFPTPVTVCYCLRPLLPPPVTAFHCLRLQRSWALYRRFWLRKTPAVLPDAATSLLTPRNARATLVDAATAASGAMQRFCKASGRWHCCFWGRATLLRRSRTLLLLLLLGQHDAPATLPHAATRSWGPCIC